MTYGGNGTRFSAYFGHTGRRFGRNFGRKISFHELLGWPQELNLFDQPRYKNCSVSSTDNVITLFSFINQ